MDTVKFEDVKETGLEVLPPSTSDGELRKVTPLMAQYIESER